MARPILIGRQSVIEHRLERPYCASARGRFRHRQSQIGRALPRLLDRLPQAPGAPGRHPGHRQGDPAPQHHGDRRHALKLGHADGLICGVDGQYDQHLKVVDEVIGKRPGVSTLAAMNYLMLPAVPCSSPTPMRRETRAPRKSPKSPSWQRSRYGASASSPGRLAFTPTSVAQVGFRRQDEQAAKRVAEMSRGSLEVDWQKCTATRPSPNHPGVPPIRNPLEGRGQPGGRPISIPANIAYLSAPR